jgi:hypothetical protein
MASRLFKSVMAQAPLVLKANVVASNGKAHERGAKRNINPKLSL